MRLLFLQGSLFGVVLLTFLNPVVGIMGYYWYTFMSPLSLAWSGSGFRWGMILAGATAVSWILNSRKINFGGGILGLFFFFICWAGITTAFADFPIIASNLYIDLLKKFIMVFMLICLVDTRQKLDVVLWIVLISVGFHTVKGGLISIVTGGSGLLTSDAILFKETNEFARGGILIFPLMVYVAIQADYRLTRWVMAICAVLTAFAILGTQSRGGAIGFAASLLYYFKVSSKKITIVLYLALMSVPMFFFMNTDRFGAWFNRMETIDEYETDNSFQGRVFAWQWAVEKLENNPFGGGLGSFHGAIYPPTGHWKDAHSIYFELLGEHGYLGLIIYILLTLMVFLKCSRIQKDAQKFNLQRYETIAVSIKAILIGFMVGGLSVSSTYHELYFFYIGITVILSQLISKDITDIELGLYKRKQSTKREF